jgi:hypothetical protein
MNISRFLPVIIAALVLALPAAGFSRDKHDWHRGGDRHWSDHHFSGRYYRPSFGYGYGYGYYPYSYYDYGYGPYYYPYYYPRSTFGFSFGPSYSYYPYSSYSSVYQGRIASGYPDGLAADVQRELRRRGFYRGSIDGNIGPASRAAIRSYQAERGLRVTGRIDSSLLRSLGVG